MKNDDEGCGEGSGKGSDEVVMKVLWSCDEVVMKVWWRCNEGVMKVVVKAVMKVIDLMTDRLTI